MKNNDVKIGMKVVPFQKTAWCKKLDSSNAWKRADGNNQPYLYVINYSNEENSWILNDKKDVDGGDYFNSCDFNPYEKEFIKGSLIQIGSEKHWEIGLKTLLTDINNEPLYIGDIVSLEGCKDSIVCTKRGDIMGIWGGTQEDIREYKVKKIKSYTELEDGEIYRGSIKVVLNKIEKVTEKQLSLKEQLKEIEQKAEELRQKIQEQENEKSINDNIAEYRVQRTEIMIGNQYIDKNKIKLNMDITKKSNYRVTYKRKGNKIICKFSSDYIVGKGVARCNPIDKFNYSKGIKIAELRARSDFYKKLADICTCK